LESTSDEENLSINKNENNDGNENVGELCDNKCKKNFNLFN
jgi:hypothetical protein